MGYYERCYFVNEKNLHKYMRRVCRLGYFVVPRKWMEFENEVIYSVSVYRYR